MNSAITFIKNLNIKNKTIVVALSGGPDSMYLINLLLLLKNELNIKIVVAHVHHNLRKESDEEAINVKKYCIENNLIFEYKKINKYPNNKFSEDVARKIRYEFFDLVMKKYSSDILFTAHHGDDLIETILMRLIRGSSIKGYAGIKAISRDRGYIIARPLLYLTKDELIKYLNKNNIWYATDMSNECIEYTRNRYRKNILPELKKENKNIHLKFMEYSNKLLLADEYLKKVASKFEIINNEIDIDKFNKLDKIIKIYVIENYLQNIYGDEIIKISDKHINIILDNILKSKNIEFNLPLDKKGIIEYNKFKIISDKCIENYDYTFIDSIDIKNHKILIDNKTKMTNNYVIHLNSKDIKLPFHVRNYKDNDKIIVKNMIGHKKVNSIFREHKISKEKIKEYPIVTDDLGEIIWIPGLKKSHFDRKKEEKYDIILKYD